MFNLLRIFLHYPSTREEPDTTSQADTKLKLALTDVLRKYDPDFDYLSYGSE